jgi:hypothetical protein
VVISAQIESDLVDLDARGGEAFLKELGVPEVGVGALIRATYHLLGLRTYFTAGEKEVRAWTIHAGDTAPKAAGVIHSDFERGFIKAETVAYDGPDGVRLRRRRAREGPLPHGRQGVRREGRRRAALQVQRLTHVVPAGCWQAARPTGSYALVGCSVGPGFDFADFTMLGDDPAAVERVTTRFPEMASLA